MLARAQADSSIERITLGAMKFPLGVYPVEPMEPRQGYLSQFEPADSEDSAGDWEEWPDRYMFDIVITAERLEPLCRALFTLLPGRIFPILDVMGRDAFREIDPYVSYDLLGLDRFTDAIRAFRDFFYEDGLVGFGAMSEDPFFYVFIDEHKIITVRAEAGLKEKVEKLLTAFDLEQVDDPRGADAAAHEHRSVLLSPDEHPDLLSADEIVEQLRDEWRLLLNIDAETNVDESGAELGVTLWRCIVRVATTDDRSRYAEVILGAGSLREAEEAAARGCAELDSDADEAWTDAVVTVAERLQPERVADYAHPEAAHAPTPAPEAGHIYSAAWLE